MIPKFPEFKKIELTDREEIEKYTRSFPPYSDFNFVSMWSWDVKGDMRVSVLNDNLVIRFNDYITSEPFYSFLGTNKVNETLETLLELSKKEGLTARLKLVPADSISSIDSNKYRIEEDKDNHDYIIPAEIFKEYSTKKTRTKRNSVKQFLNKFEPQKMYLDLSDPTIKTSIYKLFTKWSEGKEDPLEVQNELKALERFIENKCGLKEHLCIGIYLQKKLIGFCMSEELNGSYSTIHFCKADSSLSSGVYAYLLQENAKSLIEQGRTLVNIEQDLGIDNMKRWKASHGSDIFLKKYIVGYNTTYKDIANL